MTKTTEPQTCDCGTVFDAADETRATCPENWWGMCDECYQAHISGCATCRD